MWETKIVTVLDLVWLGLAALVKVFRRTGIDSVSNLFLGSYHYSLDSWFVPCLLSSS